MGDRSSYNHAYYEKHKERILAKNYAYERRRLERDPAYRERKRQQARVAQEKRRQKHRQIRLAALSTPCVDCGVRLPPQIMEFDHVRGKKLFNICHSTAGKLYVSYQMLHEEIAKCDVRCPNCHRLRHLLKGDGRYGYLREADHDLWESRTEDD